MNREEKGFAGSASDAMVVSTTENAFALYLSLGGIHRSSESPETGHETPARLSTTSFVPDALHWS